MNKKENYGLNVNHIRQLRKKALIAQPFQLPLYFLPPEAIQFEQEMNDLGYVLIEHDKEQSLWSIKCDLFD